MRKLFPLILFVVFAGSAYAQTVAFSVVTPPCNNDGVLKAYFSGVVPPLTVVWTTQGTTGAPITHTGVTSLYDILTSWSGGPLTIVATDTFGARDTGYYGGAAPFAYGFHVKPGICPALDTVSDSIGGGTPPYTTQWFNILTAAVVATGDTAHLPQGSYGVIITDAAGCVYGSKVDPGFVTLNSIPSFSVTTTSTTASCTNGTASISTGGGGVPPYSYIWSNGATTPSITGLVTGVYTVTITDALGCSRLAGIFVSQSVTITVPVVPTPATCLDTNGAIIAYGSGGVPPYHYLWSNGVTTQSQTGLTAGSYMVNVTDASGCIGSGSGTVSTSTPITVTYSTSPSLCTSPTGNATLTVSGGTTPYNITWYTTPAQVGVTATHLAAGGYYFHITDAVGCLRDGTITVPPIDVVSLTFSSVAALCTLSNGNLGVVPTGGVAPYSYAWSTGATTPGISSVPSAVYTVTVTDNLGCSVTKYPYLPDYSPISVGVASTPASCIFTNDGMNTATPYGGTPPYTYSWSSGGISSTISALPTGTYWVRVSDAAGCTSDRIYSYVGYNAAATGCYCTIQGTVFNDTNGNCVQDPGELGIPNIQVYISGRGYTYTDDSGHYSYKVPAGNYNVSETVLAYYPLAACQGNAIPVVAGSGAGCIQTVNFANRLDTIHDMHISTWDYYLQKPIPGHVYTQTTIISNDGTIPESGILASYNPDGQLFPPAFTPSGIFTGTGTPNLYNTSGGFPAINPGFAQQFFMSYNVPTNIPLGTTVLFKDSVAYDTPMTKWQLDYSPWNNVNYFTTTVVAAYDPNFKEVSPKGTGPLGLISYTDSVLEYMVHFQNTGTWPAENVVVIDTLDDNLNWTSLRPVYMSAKCKVTMQQVGAKKVATFTFNNINLPTEASNPLGSNGMFTYTIHIKPGLPVGSQFQNNASIYFDYNAPVKTNTTLNTLETAASVSNISSGSNFSSFAIYPNPASQTFNAVINSDESGDANMNISDLTGKVLVSKTITIQKGTQTITTNASQLAPGIYFVTFNNHGKVQTQKLVVVR
ncbi:MAG: T9SS type A sorting domain-containing protein [Chitinophagales bacterium]